MLECISQMSKGGEMLHILVLLALVSGPWSVAHALSGRIDKILRSYSIPRANIGIAVFDLDGKDQLIYGLNEERDFIPASLTKIMTAATVLKRMGASHKIQTGLWSSAPIKEGVLTGDIFLKGGGDSGFVSETMWFLVNELTRSGVTRIDGDLIVDDSDFDGVRNDPSRDPGRVDRAYDAPVGAMSFNWNSINIFVRPGEVGKPPHVILDPIDFDHKIDNKAKTTSGNGHKLEVSRSGKVVYVRGSIGVNSTEYVFYKNIDEPSDWSGHALLEFLKQRGITVKGKVKRGKKPVAARLLAKAESKALSQHVADMMKFSNNFVAEMLSKNLSVHEGIIPGTLDEGMKIIRQHLVDVGIDKKRFTLINPSGLSRRNMMKPVDIAKVLVAAHRHFPTKAEMLSAFPLAGQDGTLKNRMRGTNGEGWVRAKTGLLKGVVGLAGYAGRKDGSIRSFAFVFNGDPERGDLVRRMFDALAVELVQ